MSDHKISPMEKLVNLLQTNDFKSVLDVGAGKGIQSLLCASYGCLVDAVDPNIRAEFKFETWLEGHPKIQHHLQKVEDFTLGKKYDLALLLNVIMFMDKDFVLKKFLPGIKEHINEGGVIFLSYIVEEAELMAKATNQVFYTPEEIRSSLSDLNLLDSYFISSEKEHPKHGHITMTFEHLIFQKKTPDNMVNHGQERVLN